MWPVEKPKIDARESFVTCVRSARDQDRRRALLAQADLVEDAGKHLRQAAENGGLHGLDRSAFAFQDIDAREAVVWVYENGMVRTADGRRIYDQIMSGPAHETCPLCGHGIVKTLDHYLPKRVFPVLCVDPLNLVPACSDCNHTKGDLVPSSPDRTPLHPYFDRVDGAAWLHARVLQDSPVRLEFFPDPPPSWGATLVARVAHHFELFDLAKLYAVQANRTISGIRQQLARLREAGNRETVRSYLREEADTRLAERPNGWEGVTYRTLAADDSFCDGGFAQTEFRDLRPATAVPCTRLP